MKTNSLILSVLEILILASTTLTQTTRNGPRVSLRYVDKIELLSIDYGNGYIKKVNATKLVEGKEAQDILAIWKQQKLVGPSPEACHQPAYGIKFYSKGRLLLFATICWSCRNIDFIVPESKGWIEFNSLSRKGQLFKSVFTNAFPNENNVISRGATEQVVGPERRLSVS